MPGAFSTLLCQFLPLEATPSVQPGGTGGILTYYQVEINTNLALSIPDWYLSGISEAENLL